MVKNYYLIIILIIFSCGSITHKSNSSSKLYIAATKMNVLYQYIANPIQIYLPNNNERELFVSVSNGKSMVMRIIMS